MQTQQRSNKNYVIGKELSLAELENTAMGLDSATLQEIRVGDSIIAEKDYVAIRNEHSGKISAVVSDRYTLVQHQHLIGEVIDSLRGLNMNATASIRTNGDVMVCDINFPDMMVEVKAGEQFTTGLRLINSYNTSTGIIASPRLTRLACSNGMVVDVFAKGFSIRHTSAIADDLTIEVPRLIDRMVRYDGKFRAYVEACMTDSVEWETAKVIIKTLFNSEKHSGIIIDLLQKEYYSEKPSRWNIYNAITHYCTRGASLSPNMEQAFQVKAQKLLVKPLISFIPSGGAE